MSKWVPCPPCSGSGTCSACQGVGQIEAPSIKEKVARHLIYAAAHAEQRLGLGLSPEEVHELGIELGILPADTAPASPIANPTEGAPAPAPAPPLGSAEWAQARAAELIGRASSPGPVAPSADPVVNARLGLPMQPIEAQAAAAAAAPPPAAPAIAEGAHVDEAEEYDENAPPPYFPPTPDRPNGIAEGQAPELPGHVRIEPVDQPWRPVGAQQIVTPGNLTGPPGGA